MLPGELSNAYNSYKRRTNAIATYLASTAQQCGYELRDVNSYAEEPAKLRKTSNQKSRNPASRVPASSKAKKRYVIPLNLFVQLAQHIANASDPPVEVPENFLLSVQRTVAERRECSLYFQIHHEDLAEENQRHVYPIEILEQVFEILKDRVSVEQNREIPQQPAIPDSTNTPSSLVTEGNLHTRFANLLVDYTSDQYLNMPDFMPASGDFEIAEYEFEGVDDDEELHFAAKCLFKDVQKILDFLRILWKKYENKELDLLSVSIVTTAAVDQVRRLETEFGALFPEMADYEVLAKRIYKMECLSKNPDSCLDAPVHTQCYDVARWFLLSTSTMIRSFADKVGKAGFGYPRTYDEYLKFPHRDEETDKESFDADEQVLLGVLPEFCAIAREPGWLLCEDELTRGLRDVFKGGKIALWLVFAAQIFVDVHPILQNKIGNGFMELQYQAQQMTRNVQHHFTFHKSIEAKWLEEVDQYLRTSIVLPINNSVVQDVVGWTFMRVTGPEVPQPPQFHLLKRHPLLCGIMIYIMRSQFQTTCIPFLNIAGTAVTTAHLHNATLKEGYSAHTWDDMERFVQFNNLFKGVVPENGSYLSRFFFAVEGKPSKIADDTRKVKGKSEVISKIAAAISDPTPVLEVFKHRYEQDGKRPPVDKQTPAERHRFVEETWAKLEPFLNEHWAIHVDSTDIPALSEIPKGKHKAIQQRSQPRTALELLVALQLSLNIELPRLLFDYLAFHRTCWELLRKLKADLMPLLLKYFKEGFLADETGLYMLPGYILMTADGSGKLRKKIALREMKGVPLTMTLLQGAGRVIDEFLGSQD
jgi:hypothetical protein